MYGGSPHVQVRTKRRVWPIWTLQVGPHQPDPRPNPKPNPNPNPNPLGGSRSARGRRGQSCAIHTSLLNFTCTSENLARTCDYTGGDATTVSRSLQSLVSSYLSSVWATYCCWCWCRNREISQQNQGEFTTYATQWLRITVYDMTITNPNPKPINHCMGESSSYREQCASTIVCNKRWTLVLAESDESAFSCFHISMMCFVLFLGKS